MSLRKLALGWLLATSLPLLSLVLVGHAAAQGPPYDVPDFSGKIYDVVLQMATDPHTHRQVFTHIDTPPSPGATVLRQLPYPAHKHPVRREEDPAAVLAAGPKETCESELLDTGDQPVRGSAAIHRAETDGR